MSEPTRGATDPPESKDADSLLTEFQTRAAAIPADTNAETELLKLEQEMLASPLEYPHIVLALFTLNSVTVNIGDDLDNEMLVATGLARATALLAITAEPVLVSQILQNIANAEAILFRFEAKAETAGASQKLVEGEARFRDGSHVVAARQLWSMVARLPATPDFVRSRALCNLANELDLAGRWVEAYSAYADALEAEPTNGNAAGNRAMLLLQRLNTSPQQAGHIAAVYEKWARRAKELRSETVAIAGEHAAQLWDALPVSGEPVQGHLSHDGDLDDPYQKWIVQHRLALVPTVEGLGSDSSRWDTADILAAVVDNDEGRAPRIFAAMNVLKAEFIVARRLAFRGEQMTFTEDGSQHPEDTGVYGATGDGAIYGEGPATLLLAQRSALDLLDKIAVTANEHFKTGIPPQKVDFASYWHDTKARVLRPEVTTMAGRRARLALAELQRDLASDALYPSARLLRNAGTHRLVHGTLGEPTGPTKETFSTIDLIDLQESTIEALWVARAAFLYLIDVIDAETPELEGLTGELHSQV
ncbi:hypothetical protein BH10ACT7_BH10ACT7_04270 [soil metagenome]